MRLASRLATAMIGAARGLSRSSPRMSSLSSAPTVTLNDGTAHPQIGFGTYKVGFIPASASAAVAGAEASGGEVATATDIVRDALDVGYASDPQLGSSREDLLANATSGNESGSDVD